MACFNAWDIGACGCTVPTFVVTCKGCNSFLFTSGKSIQIWTSSGGTLLATYTTNGSGQVSIPAGTYWIIPANGRFAGGTHTISAATTITFSAATGYVCCSTLWWPYPTTLYWTDGDIGPQAITVGASGGVFTYNQHSSVGGCDSSHSCTTNSIGNPFLSLGISCSYISRGWLTTHLCGSGNLYDINGPVGLCRVCVDTAGRSSNTGFTSTTDPPFAFSGVLSTTTGSGGLADPVGGTVVISE